jgi:hypothetical protein
MRIPSMMQRQNRMTHQQPWTRIPHNLPHPLLHIRPITVNGAFAAGCFFVLEGAFAEAQKRVVLEFLAFLTEGAVGVVVAFAVDFCHDGYGSSFAFHSFVFGVWGLRLHICSTDEYGVVFVFKV